MLEYQETALEYQKTTLEYQELTLKDRDLLNSFFSSKQFENSEFSFANLYIWRHSCFIQYSIKDEVLYINGRYKKTFPFFMPPIIKNNGKSYKEPMMIIVEEAQQLGIPFLVKGVTQELKDQIEGDCPGIFLFEEDPDNDEYVYNSLDLIHLEGRKYHSKRNHINRFISSYNYSYEPLCAENMDECMISCIEWFSKKDSSQYPDLEDERDAIVEALHHMEALGLVGGAIRVDEKIQAFTIGELLNSQMALIHIEKANPEIPGLYTMINQKFAEQTWAHVPFINREEDMGIPGLRRAKHSYYPCHMVKKYNIRLK